MTREAIVGQNTRATRIAFVAAGGCAEFALQPLVPVAEWLPLFALFLVVAIAVVGQPFAPPKPPPGTAGRWVTWPVRQIVAVVVIGLAGVEALTRLRPGDLAAEGRTLALLMMFVQFAHALASRTRRETALGCGVVVPTLAVAGVFDGDVTLLLPMTLSLAAVAVIAALLHRDTLLESATAVSAGAPNPAIRACAAPLALALAISALLFLALPNAPRLRTHTPFGGSAGSAGLSGFAGDRATSGVGAVGATTLDLNTRGKLSDTPVLAVDASAPQYWQGAIFADFDGRSWHSSAQGGLQLWTPAGGMLRPSERQFEGQSRTDTATVLNSAVVDVVLSPGMAAGYAGDGVVISDADGNARFAEGRPARNTSYTVMSVAPNASDDALRGATGADVSDPRWRFVPSTVAPRVRTLAAQLAGSASNRFDTVAAIEDYLKSHETYDINSPLPQRGDDPVDDFLFVSHRGFCEQFATAAVVMLRSVGVPARLVTGFAFGDTSAQPGKRVFRGSDAHAWVQVYYPGVGWVASEATASGAAGAASSGNSSLRGQIADAVRSAWRKVPHGRVGAFVVVCVALVLGFAGTLLAGRWMIRRRRVAAVGPAAQDGPVLAAYLRLERALAAQERARAPGETFAEFARRLGGLAVGPSEVHHAMRCLERECYATGRRAPAAAEVDAAVAVFDRLCAAVKDDVAVVVAAVGPARRR